MVDSRGEVRDVGGYVKAFAVSVTVLSCVFLVVAHWMGSFWQWSGRHVSPYTLDLLLRVWRVLPSVWLVLLAAVVCAMWVGWNTRLKNTVSFALLACVVAGVPFLSRHTYPDMEKTYRYQCLSNIKQISLGLAMYSEDYNGSLPPLGSWNEAVYPYTKSNKFLVCPFALYISDLPSYALNGDIKRLDVSNPPRVVMVFDSVPGKNKVGGPELFPSPSRHHGFVNVGCADGHAKLCTEAEARKLAWKP